MPVTINEILLRGCTLKNSGRAYGVVVYTGPESRIQMNAAEPPRKVGEPHPKQCSQLLPLTFCGRAESLLTPVHGMAGMLILTAHTGCFELARLSLCFAYRIFFRM